MDSIWDTKQYQHEYIADTVPYVELHSSAVISVPWLCSDSHSSKWWWELIFLYFIYIYVFAFFVKGNVLFDI